MAKESLYPEDRIEVWMAALALAGVAAGFVKTRFLKNPATKKMTVASGKVSRLLRLSGFSGCMASFLWGRGECGRDG